MPNYATVSIFKNEVQVESAVTDAMIERLLDAAEETVDAFCNRSDGFLADAAASARYYAGSGTFVQWIDECVAVTAVAVKDGATDDEDAYTAWTIGTVGSTTEADVFPATGDPKAPTYSRTPYTFLIVGANGDYDTFTSGSFSHRRGFRPHTTHTRGLPTVQVTARWGYAASVPDRVRQATIAQAARWYQRFKASMADTTAGPEFGRLMFRKTLDPDVQMMLWRYVKPATGRSY
jgi:hypothetical protein